MAIDWNTMFTLPMSNRLDVGKVTSGKEFANLLATQYDLAVRAGMTAAPSVPSPFMVGDKVRMATIIERYLFLYNNKIFASNIIAQRQLIRQTIRSINLYRTVYKDLLNQLRNISRVEKQFISTLKQIKVDIKQVVNRQISTAEEVFDALAQSPQSIATSISVAIERDINNIQNSLTFSAQDLLNPSFILEKIMSITTLVNRVTQQLSILINIIATINPRALTQSVIELATPSFDDIISKYTSNSPIVFLAPIIRRLKIKIKNLLRELLDKIALQKDKLLTKIQSTDKKPTSIQSVKRVDIQLYRKNVQYYKTQITNLTSQHRQILSEIAAVRADAMFVTSQINAVRSSIRTQLNSVGIPSSAISPKIFDGDLSTIDPAIRAVVFTGAVLTRLNSIKSKRASNDRRVKYLSEKSKRVQMRIAEMRAKLLSQISAKSSALGTFNSYFGTAKVMKDEILARKRSIEMYYDMMRSMRKNIRNILSIKRLISSTINSLSFIGPQSRNIQRIASINRSLTQLSDTIPSLGLISKLNGKLNAITDELIAIDKLRMFGLNVGRINDKQFAVISKLQQIINLSIDPIELRLHSMLDKLASDVLVQNQLIRQQELNPQSLSLTTAMSLAIQSYWAGGVWVGPSGTYSINNPGSSLFALGILLKNKPSVSSLPFLRELQKAFFAHAKSISGTYTDNSSGTTVSWIGYN